MQLDNIFSDFVNHQGEEIHKRQLGRYWSTDVGSIKKGYLTAEKFFEPRTIDSNGVRMVLTGMAMEDMLTKIFHARKVDCKTQEKKIIKINDEIELVVKPDYIFPEFVIETKFPFSSFNPTEIPDRYNYQLECEYQAFMPKRIYLGVFTIPFNLTMIEYIPSSKRWANIKKIITDFHNELKSLNGVDEND